MLRLCLTLSLLGLALVFSLAEAHAQNRTGQGALIGGATGAAIGGIAGGGRGALIGGAIGAGTGAVIGSQAQRRRGHHYWYNGRCWLRLRNGQFRVVSNRYCR